MTEPMKTAEEILRAKFSGLSHKIVTPVHPVQKTLIVAAMQEYADQEKSAERERIKHSIYLLYKNNDKPPVLGAIHEIIDSFMTEPIDQPTKDLIEKEAEKIIQQELGIKPGASLLTPMDYGECLRCISKASTVWAEKLRRLETQSHDQVRIIEHLEQELAKERELRKELVDGFLKLFQMELHIPSEHWVEWSGYHKQIESLIKKAKEL